MMNITKEQAETMRPEAVNYIKFTEPPKPTYILSLTPTCQ